MNKEFTIGQKFNYIYFTIDGEKIIDELSLVNIEGDLLVMSNNEKFDKSWVDNGLYKI